MNAPTIDDIRAAADRIAPHVHRTPVLSSHTFDRELGAQVFFKCENLQKVGAFKARGAVNAVLSLDPPAASRGVITHSSGNHGAAVAYAAKIRGLVPDLRPEPVRGVLGGDVAQPADHGRRRARVHLQAGHGGGGSRGRRGGA